MRSLFTMTMTLAAGILGAVVFAAAQGPRRENRDGPQSGAGQETAVARLMAFDKNKDGKLSKEELNDERLDRLFDRADADRDGLVTTAELTSLFARESATYGEGRGGPDGGPGGPGGRGPGAGPSGPGGGPGGTGGRGPGGFAAPPQPGQILPAALQDALQLTGTQRQQLAELQKEVDARLDRILSAEQKQQLRELRDRGPGGFGPPPAGPNGPGGNPGERQRPEAKKKNS